MAKGNCSPNGWTLDTLERFLSTKVEFLRESIELALTTSDKALTKAETSIEKRFDSVNEFRQALSDQTQNFLTKDAHEVKYVNIEDKINTLAERVSSAEAIHLGKTTGLISVGNLVVGMVSVVSALTSATAIIYTILK